MKSQKQTQKTAETQSDIASIDSAQLDNVSGGCAACGMANCTMTNPAAARTLFGQAFRR